MANPPPAPTAALEAILEVIGRSLGGADPEDSLASVLRSRPNLRSEERAIIARHALGVACLRTRMRAFVEAGGLEASPRHLLLAYRVRELGMQPAEAAILSEASLEAAGVLARCEPAWPSHPVERLAMQGSLPLWLASLWIEEWGEREAFALAEATNRPGPVTLRANALRGTRDEVARQLAAEGIATEPGQLAPHALHVQGRANLFGSATWRSGGFEVQDEGSQWVIEACAARPGERWLDLCAGSGGKTLGLAASLGNRGELWATDIDSQKLDNLRARLRRSGAEAKVVRLAAGDEEQALGSERFDGILVDAPCSELGTLRRHPGARWRIRPGAMAELPPLQRRLLRLAESHLAPDGRLIYATCTLHRAENEDVVGPAFTWRTLAPHRTGTDGFFIAGRSGCETEARLK